MIRKFSLYFISFFLVCSACEPDKNVNNGGKEAVADGPPDTHCGNSMMTDVRSDAGQAKGVFEVLNDSQHVWFVYSTSHTMRMQRAFIYAGPESAIPKDGNGNVLRDKFNYKFTNTEEAKIWFRSVPLDEFPACFVVLARFEVADLDEEGAVIGPAKRATAVGKSGSGEQNKMSYCLRVCGDGKADCPNGTAKGEFLSVPQSAWADSAGAGKAIYLRDNFKKAFNDGLRLGCNQQIVFESAEDVLAFLPSEGQPGVLPENVPGPAILKNALAGELCALSLCLGFDEHDAAFSRSPAQLSILQISTGPFRGWRVHEIVQEANTVLGGCASNYNPDQLREVLKRINLNFAGAEVDLGFLTCDFVR